jgi:hypothetical protein
MIEMMGDLARRVAQLMEELEYLHQLDDASRLHCGVPLKALEELSLDSLMDMMAREPRLYASEILYLRAGERHVHLEEREQLLLKSLRLLVSLESESVLCEARSPRLKELKNVVLPLLSSDDLLRCASFFREGDMYNEMEDALFQAVDRCGDPDERRGMIRLGAEMLRTAAESASEHALIYCSMSREELRQAAMELAAVEMQ